MIYQLLYRSVSIYPGWHPSDLDILKKAIPKNKALGVCGYLVRDQNQFFQVLEGPEHKVKKLFLRISGDNRHADVECLVGQHVREALFERWTMGYQVERVSGSLLSSVMDQAHSKHAPARSSALLREIEQIAQIRRA